jgi:eukaryotic-like serine/threonine-protein kinase
MNSSQAHSVESIFFAALERSSAQERAAYLDRACGADRELRGQVERLLRAQPHVGTFLETPVAGATVAGPCPGEPPGTVIGPYRLLEVLGEGGMGTVYRAEQTHPVHRQVALKLIRAGRDSREVVGRFEAERQALALMDHPHIARVLDAGATPAGRPYFVMELVQGVPLTRYCDEHRLTVRQRLELAIPVCRAVQHAHQKGVIHRDLKPSNVLVTLCDGRAVPKVIDFGVAKATGPALSERTLLTEVGAVVGTPEYMSPEQADLDNLDIDTRSDLYALGVLLYELLTGTTPLQRRRGGEPLLELLRRIREEEPPAPSARLSHSEGLATIAANRGLEPRKLTRLVRGELDWIVLKCLEKDRNRRYETVNALSLDLQRYLHDEPVLACPPSVGYRVKKFLRRHRGPVLAAALVLLALVGGVAMSTWQAVRATQAERDAVQGEADARKAAAEARRAGVLERAERERAQANADLAWKAGTDLFLRLEFAGALFQWPKSSVEEKAHRDLSERVLKYYQDYARLNGENPKVRSRIATAYRRTGKLHANRGEYEQAREAFTKAINLSEQVIGSLSDQPEHREDRALARLDLAKARQGLAPLLRRTGKLAEARRLYEESVKLIEEVVRAAPPLKPAPATADPPRLTLGTTAEHETDAHGRLFLAESLTELAVLLSETGRVGAAERTFDKALKLWGKLAAAFPRSATIYQRKAVCHYKLAGVLLMTGRLEGAERQHDLALNLRQRLVAAFLRWPRFREELASSHYFRGVLLIQRRRPAEAEQECARALKLSEALVAEYPRVTGYQNGRDLALSYRGFALRDIGRFPEAEKSLRMALAGQRQRAKQFPDVLDYQHQLAQTLTNLGVLLAKTQRGQEAVRVAAEAVRLEQPLYDRARHVHRYALGLALGLSSLGGAALETGDLPQARQALERAVRCLRALVDANPPNPEYLRILGGCHESLWVALRRMRLPAEGLAAMEEAVRVREKLATLSTSLDDEEGLARALTALGILWQQMKGVAAGEGPFRKALGVCERLDKAFPNTPKHRSRLGDALARVAGVLQGRGELRRAREYLDRAIKLQRAAVDADPQNPEYRWFLGDTYGYLSALLEKMGLPVEAEGALEEVVRQWKEVVQQRETRGDRARVLTELRFLAGVLNRLGMLRQRTKGLSAAEAPFREELALREVLHEAFPHSPEHQSGLGSALNNVAWVLMGRGELRPAREHLDRAIKLQRAAVDADPQNPQYRLFLIAHYRQLAGVLVKQGEHAGAARAAEELPRLYPKVSKAYRDAALLVAACIPLARRDSRLAEERREALARSYGDRAMSLLREAGARGFPDVGQLRKDARLGPLHARDDFRKWIAEVEAKLKK